MKINTWCHYCYDDDLTLVSGERQAVVRAEFSGQCVGITDGDTISVMHNGRSERIRLHGIDCPESHQAFGSRAKQFTSSLVAGNTVRVEVKDTEGDTGQVWIVIDGESYPMVSDPDDTDTMDGQRFTYETKMSKGDHTYYFTGKDSFGNDAVGSSAGEDNTKSSPDVSEKKVSDTPGPAAILVAMAMLTLVALHRVRRRMGSRP